MNVESDLFSEEIFFEEIMKVLGPSNINIEIVESLTDTTAALELPWTITRGFIEDDPEPKSQRISRIMGAQAGNDLWELIFNGDTNSDSPLLKAMDGFHKMSANTDVWTVKIASSDMTHEVDDSQHYFVLKLLVLMEESSLVL